MPSQTTHTNADAPTLPFLKARLDTRYADHLPMSVNPESKVVYSFSILNPNSFFTTKYNMIHALNIQT